MPLHARPQPPNTYRILALGAGVAYLFLLAHAFSFVTKESIVVTGFWVALGAVGVMGSLAFGCMKLVSRQSNRRLRLATLLLLFVPLAIYLAAIRIFIRGWLSVSSGSPAEKWTFLFFVVSIAVVVTTIVLLPFAEALMAIMLSLGRRFSIIRPTRRAEDGSTVRLELLESVAVRRGHFVYESGHHGDLWLDLELLCLNANRVEGWAFELSKRLAHLKIQAVCGPLVEGAFIALFVAEQLNVEFAYAVRIDHPEKTGLFPIDYCVPNVLRDRLRGKRVAIVNDVINAGSAVRGTASDLQVCGAQLVAMACLATIGNSAIRIAEEHDVPLFRLTAMEARLWAPDVCPLCRDSVPLAN